MFHPSLFSFLFFGFFFALRSLFDSVFVQIIYFFLLKMTFLAIYRRQAGTKAYRMEVQLLWSVTIDARVHTLK